MSVVRRDGTKIVLDRRGKDTFWERVQDRFDGQSDLLWRYLAMLALNDVAGWSVEQIGRAFGHNRGHISRCIERVRTELRHEFGDRTDRASPEDRRPPPNDHSGPRF